MDKLTLGLVATLAAVGAIAYYGARKEAPTSQAQPSIDPKMVIRSPFKGDNGMVKRSPFQGDNGIVRRPPTLDQLQAPKGSKV